MSLAWELLGALGMDHLAREQEGGDICTIYSS